MSGIHGLLEHLGIAHEVVTVEDEVVYPEPGSTEPPVSNGGE